MKLLCFVLMMTDCQLTRSGPWHFRPLFECAFMGAHSVMNCRTCVVPCSISCVFQRHNRVVHKLLPALITYLSDSGFSVTCLEYTKEENRLVYYLAAGYGRVSVCFYQKIFLFFSFQHTQLFSSWVSLCLCKYLLLVSSQSGQVNTWLRQVCFLI